MTDAEKLLIRAGATRIRATKHRVYILNGQRFTIHNGSKNINYRLIRQVRSKLRQMEQGK